ncbi:MAG: hypothetical protein ACFFC6_06655 [Promethearchaeota archaeon]
MSDKLEQETIKKLTSVGSVLKNPFTNLEDILTQLGKLDEKPLVERKFDLTTLGKEARRAVEEELNSSNESLTKVLYDLGNMFKVCGICSKGTLENEIISGVCLDCYRKGEVIIAQNKKIDELEAQIRNMESKISNTSRDYMSDVINEILTTIRKHIEHDINSIRNKLSSPQNTLPPPPPPPPLRSQHHSKDQKSIDFSQMTLEELKQFQPGFLSELPISLRNQYNARLKELKLINKMTPKQRETYFEKKRKEQEQTTKLNDLKNSLKNLGESDNPLFLKMKKRAEESVLAGQGTLGNFGEKKIFINCQKCNTTNNIIEGKETLCKNCHSPLRV